MNRDLIRTYKLALIGVETYLSVKDIDIITKLYNIFGGLEILITPTPKNLSVEYCRRILDDDNRNEFKIVFELFYLNVLPSITPYIKIVENLEDELKNDFFITEILSDIYNYKQKPHKILYHGILSDKITLEGQKHLKTLKQLGIGIESKGFNTDI